MRALNAMIYMILGATLPVSNSKQMHLKFLCINRNSVRGDLAQNRWVSGHHYLYTLVTISDPATWIGLLPEWGHHC